MMTMSKVSSGEIEGTTCMGSAVVLGDACWTTVEWYLGASPELVPTTIVGLDAITREGYDRVRSLAVGAVRPIEARRGARLEATVLAVVAI